MIKFKSESIRKNNVLANLFVLFSFFLLSFLSVSIISPIVSSNAEEQSFESEVGPYTMSLSNDSLTTIAITPTSSQQVFTASNDITLSNTCSSGATIAMSTASSSNSLTRIGDDDATKSIPSINGTNIELTNNTWGYSLSNGESYNKIPTSTDNTTYIYNEEESSEDRVIPILFGIKTDNNMPSGTYTNDIVYTLTPKAGCLTYAITWDLDGGTGASGKTYPSTLNWGQTINLSTLTPTKDDYTFKGWKVGTNNFTGEETEANINPDNLSSITITAQWELIIREWEFDYTGSVQTFTVPSTGYYKLEVWGAQGETIDRSYDTKWSSSSGSVVNIGGYGGYSYGIYNANQVNGIFYIVVGSNNQSGCKTSSKSGYNGGGSSGSTVYESYYYGCSGGGATHIATKSGLLSTLSSYRSDILIVAGGGGGSPAYPHSSSDKRFGGSGGGYIGGTGGEGYGNTPGVGGNQSSAGSTKVSGGFGYGGSGEPGGSCLTGSGGGGGLYGGGGSSIANCAHVAGGGGGSGYIGNSLLTNKGMYMYSSGCSSSTATDTKTTCTANTGAHISEYANTGNGYAKITYLGTSI